MIDQKEIIPGLGYLARNEFYAEAVRLVPDADKAAHIQIALSLSHARMKGEADGYDKVASDLELMATRLRSSASVLRRERVGKVA